MRRRFTAADLEVYLRDRGPSVQATCRAIWAAIGPSRKTRSDAYHGSGRVASDKAGRTRDAESKSEYLVLRLLGFRKDVLWYATQPGERVRREFVTVDDESGIRRVSHADATMDAFVFWADRAPGWVDIKTRAAVEQAIAKHPGLYVCAPDGRVSCPTGDAFAAARGLTYTVIVIDDLDPVELANALYAEAFLSVDVPEDVLTSLRCTVASAGRISLAALRVAGYSVDHVIAAAYRTAVFIDFSKQPLREQELVWVYLDPIVAAEVPEPVVVSIGGRRPGSVHLAVGEEVLHCGRSHRIEAVSAASVRLVPTEVDGPSVTLGRLEVETLVNSGALIGLGPLDPKAREDASRIERLFAGAGPETVERAEERLACLELYWEGERVCFPRVDGQEISIHAVRDWQTRFRRAEELGCGFAGLLDRPQIGRPGSHLLEETQRLIDEVAREFYLDPGRTPSVAAFHRLIEGRAAQLAAQGIVVAAPSYAAVLTWVDHRDNYQTLFRRKGHRGSASMRPWAHFDADAASPSGQFPGDMAFGDATLSDISCPERFTREGNKRPWQFRLVDGLTGKKLGEAWCFGRVDEDVVLEALRDQIRRFGFLSAVYVLDNAMEHRSERVQRFLARHGCHVLYRRMANGRDGLPVEREFGAINTDTLHSLRGNTRIARDVRSMDPALDPRKRATWPLHELIEAVNRRDAVVEATRHVAALRMTTDEAWDRRHEHGLRKARLLRWSTQLERDLGVIHDYQPMVDNTDGIWVNRLYYWHPSLEHPTVARVKLKVITLRHDVGRVWAWLPQHTHDGIRVPGEWIECHTRSPIGRDRVTFEELSYYSKVILAYNKGHHARKKIENGQLGFLLAGEIDHEQVLQEETRQIKARNGRTGIELPDLPRGDVLAAAPLPSPGRSTGTRLAVVERQPPEAGLIPVTDAPIRRGIRPVSRGSRTSAVAAAFAARQGDHS